MGFQCVESYTHLNPFYLLVLQNAGSGRSDDAGVTQPVLSGRRRELPVAVLGRTVRRRRQRLRQPRSAASTAGGVLDPVPDAGLLRGVRAVRHVPSAAR